VAVATCQSAPAGNQIRNPLNITEQLNAHNLADKISVVRIGRKVSGLMLKTGKMGRQHEDPELNLVAASLPVNVIRMF
jgi:hypothetical protein